MQFKKFWNYILVFLTIVFHKNAQNIIPFSEKNLSQKDAILENNSAGQVSCEAHFSGTWTEVEGAPPANGCHPLFSPRLKQSSVAESEAESIEEESSGFYDLKLVASKI